MTGTLPNGQDDTLAFDLTVEDPCPTATITPPSVSDVTYTQYENEDVTIGHFTPSVADSICGAMTYEAKQDGTTLDNAIFTFDDSPPTLSIYSDDPSEAGTYSFEIIAH